VATGIQRCGDGQEGRGRRQKLADGHLCPHPVEQAGWRLGLSKPHTGELEEFSRHPREAALTTADTECTATKADNHTRLLHLFSLLLQPVWTGWVQTLLKNMKEGEKEEVPLPMVTQEEGTEEVVHIFNFNKFIIMRQATFNNAMEACLGLKVTLVLFFFYPKVIRNTLGTAGERVT
jgi:hypothetical protein